MKMQVEMSPGAGRMTRYSRTKRAIKPAVATGKRNKTPPVVGRQFLWPSALLLSVAILSLSGSTLRLDLASCEPAQQRGQAQAQQQSNELTGLQDSSQFSSSGGGGDGASLGEGLAALAGNYKRGPYTNAKRARKMSAFMPMRGRKDGRDLIGWDSLRDLQPPGTRYLAPMAAATNFGPSIQQQQPDSAGAATAGQLMSSSFGLGNQQLASIRESDPNDATLVRLFNGHATMPRQFFNQMQLRTGGVEETARQAPGSSGDQAGPARGAGQRSFEQSAGNGNQIMQAKLRRAFHPMRGKKATTAPLAAGQLEDLFAGLDQFSSMSASVDEI